MGRFDNDTDTDEAPVKSQTQQVEADEDGDDDSAAEFDEAAARKAMGRGWGKAEQVKAASSNFAETFKPDTKVTLVKFLDTEPYTSFQQHWLEGRVGQKSF